MRVKKYTAVNMQEAMKKVKDDLGNDAVILNSKATMTGGFFGLFSKKQIEVLAAADPDPSGGMKPVQEEWKEPERKEPARIYADSADNLYLNELESLKSEYRQLASSRTSYTLPQPIETVRQTLVGQEAGPEQIDSIVQRLLAGWYKQDQPGTEGSSLINAKRLLMEDLETIPFSGLDHANRCIAIAGQTGVGKTTTIAKLAADFVIHKKKSVAFITTDTYRISAIDQLKTYAKILDVPIEVCYSEEDFEQAKQKFSHIDHIFIDTAGRNYKNGEYIQELTSLLKFGQDIDLYLTLSAASKKKDMLAIIKRFEALPVKQFIFTKLDETDTFGAIYEAVITAQIGIACFTAGQNVPDDVMPASAEALVGMLMGETK